MANLGDLRTRIITEINRDDLRDDLAAQLDIFIQSAIDDYAVRPFWFSEYPLTQTATAGSAYVTIPSGIRAISQVWLVIGGNRYIMCKRDEADIIDLYMVNSTGQPTDYSHVQDTLHIWPLPNIDYAMIWECVNDQPALDYTDAASENVWTNAGQDLIVALTKKNLYRDQFRDIAGMQMAQAAEDRAYSKLRGESNVKIMTGRMRTSW